MQLRRACYHQNILHVAVYMQISFHFWPTMLSVSNKTLYDFLRVQRTSPFCTCLPSWPLQWKDWLSQFWSWLVVNFAWLTISELIFSKVSLTFWSERTSGLGKLMLLDLEISWYFVSNAEFKTGQWYFSRVSIWNLVTFYVVI